MMKVGLVWYFTVIANGVSIKYVEVNKVIFHGNPTANVAIPYHYMEMRSDSRKSEISIVKRSIKRQRYDEFMFDLVTKNSKAVAVTISLAATITMVIITIAVAIISILQCSLCYDQFIPENTII